MFMMFWIVDYIFYDIVSIPEEHGFNGYNGYMMEYIMI